MAVKIMSKWELKRVGRAVGATPIVKLECPTPDEMGYADEVNFCEISSTWCTVFRRDTDENKMATIILRGSTHAVLDDIERAIDNGVNAVKSLIRDNRLVAGVVQQKSLLQMKYRSLLNHNQVLINTLLRSLEFLLKLFQESWLKMLD